MKYTVHDSCLILINFVFNGKSFAMFLKKFLFIFLLLNFSTCLNAEDEVEESKNRFKIEGKVVVLGEKMSGI